MAVDKENEFGLDSSDEEEVLQLTLNIENPTLKRKAPTDLSISNKRPVFAGTNDVPTYPERSEAAVQILKCRFGKEKFLLKQEAVIARLLHGGSAVVVFPTGGGKSLCFQIPALGLDGGITLVISPLIALMKDQVDALLQRGIKAAVMDSTKTTEQHLETCRALRAGEIRLLYCAPERLNNEGFVDQMERVRGGIRLVAIDEAHCISEWGHAFRPDYLKLSRFVKEVKAERVVCLTATATPKVAQDICNAFDIDQSGLFRASSYRSNLQLLAESAPTKQALYSKLFNFLKGNPGPTIVYVTLQKQTEALADDLRKKGFKAHSFHAGMATKEKTKLQDDFMKANDLIIVATIAFGMGIDKANIRNVVHFNIPSSLESYSQEIGRAGRDGKISKCLLFLCGEDLHLREMFARGDLPSHVSVIRLMRDIFKPENTGLAIGECLRVSHSEQCKTFDIRETTLGNIYAQLDLRFELLRATTPMYTKYSFVEGSKFFQYSTDQTPVALVVRAASKKAKTIYQIDVTAAAQYNISRTNIIRKLTDWDEMGVIQLRHGGLLHVYRVLKKVPSADDDIQTLAAEIYSKLQELEQDNLKRMDQILDLVTRKACFSKTLAGHFGDELDKGEECGHCTWCFTHQAVPLVQMPKKAFNIAAFNRILEAVKARDDPRFLAKLAFGIRSPRLMVMKIHNNHPLFGSMQDHNFEDLLGRFTDVC